MPIHIKGSGGIVKQGTQEAPSIVVNDSGLITATAGGLSATHQLTTQSGQTITPNINNQIIPNGRYLTGDQIIEGDENLKSSNIKSGVSIFGIDGELDVGITLPPLNAPGSAADLRSGKELIDANGNTITGSVTSRTNSSVTTSNNVVTIPAGIYDSQVQKTVGTAKSAATYIPGTSDQTISSGYYLTGAQTIKGDSNLVASNIKSGVSIFGVNGSLADGCHIIDIYYDADSWGSELSWTTHTYTNGPDFETLIISPSNLEASINKIESVCVYLEDIEQLSIIGVCCTAIGYDSQSSYISLSGYNLNKVTKGYIMYEESSYFKGLWALPAHDGQSLALLVPRHFITNFIPDDGSSSIWLAITYS